MEEHVDIQKPKSVSVAVKLLWVSLALGLFTDATTSLSTLPSSLIIFAIGAFIVFKISVGKNWARITFLVLSVMGVMLYLNSVLRLLSLMSLSTMISAIIDLSSKLWQTRPVYYTLSLIQVVIKFFALFLLFTKTGNDWFRKSAEQGGLTTDIVTLKDACIAYRQHDYSTALRIFRPLAEDGDKEAQFFLGAMYEYGYGVPVNYKVAHKWFRKSAEQGCAESQLFLGNLYEQGMGVPHSDTEAVIWFKKAAEQGNAGAICKLGDMYANGKGVTQDDVEAVRYYHLAAEKGNATAQYELGIRYSNGKGVTKDDVEAVKYYRISAEKENAEAQFALGARYLKGRGIPVDPVEAAKWFLKAAEYDIAGAQMQLGVMYGNGNGVPQDYVQAYKWYNITATRFQWHPVFRNKATDSRDSVAIKMTPEQIAEAQKLAREWKPKTKEQSLHE